MSKIVKNPNSYAVVVEDVGDVSIPAQDEYLIDPNHYDRWSASSDLVTLMGTEGLYINDGSVDLNPSESIDCIKGIFPKKIAVGNEVLDQFLTFVSDRLKVDALISGVTLPAPSYPTSVVYDDLNVANGGVARETTIEDDGEWVKLYEYEGAGFFCGTTLKLGSADSFWYVRVLLDSHEVFGSEGIYTTDLKTVYDFVAGNDSQSNTFSGLSITSSIFKFTTPNHIPISFTTGAKIYVKRSIDNGSKDFFGGLAVLNKEA